MRPPAQLWRCERPASDLSDLTRAVRTYLTTPGARTMTSPNLPARPLTGVEYTLAVAAYGEAESPDDDPDAPLTPHERMLVAAQDELFASRRQTVEPTMVLPAIGWELG